ncbi:hypothetical protein FKM82_020938 [Ascaphus truei]
MTWVSFRRTIVGTHSDPAFLHRPLQQGTIQKITIAKTNRMTRRTTASWVNHCRHPDNHKKYWSQGSVIPEFRLSSSDKFFSLLIAVVTLPSGPVFPGMYVQHASPIIWQTPPFSANSISRAFLLFQETRICSRVQ